MSRRTQYGLSVGLATGIVLYALLNVLPGPQAPVIVALLAGVCAAAAGAVVRKFIPSA